MMSKESVAFQEKVKVIMRSQKEKRRQTILARLKELEDEKRRAQEKNEHRDLTKEEKSLRELVFPDKLALPVHPNFRLWMGTIQVAGFPQSFARKCLKVSLELPTSIRPNSLKTLGSISDNDFLSITNHYNQYRRLLFSIIVMHATINQRENFRSFGWTQPYFFSPNDF